MNNANNTILNGINNTHGNGTSNGNNSNNQANNDESKEDDRSTSIVLPWNLLEGESLIMQEPGYSEIYFSSNDDEKIKGNFFITNYRFYFNSDLNETICVIDTPLGFVERIDKIIAYQTSELTGIFIYCKNGQKFNFSKVENDTMFEKNVYSNLNQYAFPESNNLELFAFSYKPKLENNDGWNVYNAEKEYHRLGVHKNPKWIIVSDWNRTFRLCDTYPSTFVVPSCVDERVLESIAQFRSRNRFPVLSWINENNVPLMRSSQPLCGMLGRRNQIDENYLRDIAEMNSKSADGFKHLLIVDARPFKNALANCTSGGGYENEKYYTSCKVTFIGIENIHTMRDSLGTSNEHFVSSLENSKWLEHIKLILDGALLIVDKINSGHSVLVHCSDGWDRTAQLTSLSMILLDKYYRTIEGFQVLIEKEWLSFGHKFGTRMGHGSDKYSDQDRSPIFIQFIDCVWQILKQQPYFFEFNENLLLTILENIYTCRFGTFLMDSECEREKFELKSKTVSIWSYVNSNKNEFKNEQYLDCSNDISTRIQIRLEDCKLWTNYYFQHKHTSMDKTNKATSSSAKKNAEAFGNLFDNIFSNSYRLFNRILEKY